MVNKMRVAMFSSEDVNGGAARACVRLNYGLLKDNRIDVKYFVKNKIEDAETTFQLYRKKDSSELLESELNQFYIHRNRTDLTNTLFTFSYCDTILPNLSDYDIINLHWVEVFLSFNNLDELIKLNKPLVWTLHDMKAFTGGCHYNAGCRSFEDDCGECLQVNSSEMKLPQRSLHVKSRILQDANITIVTPSQWLAQEARKSALFQNKRVEVIPYGVDVELFHPVDKVVAKQKFGISKDSIILTFGVMTHNEERKGFKELVQAIELLKEKIKGYKVIGLFFGSECSSTFPIPLVNVGQVNKDELLRYIYSAADIFILPSLEDNLPNTILESLACETPVIAFDTRGAKDLICEENGKIVAKGDVEALSEAIYELIMQKDKREKKGKNGRVLIKQKYQLHHQAELYIQLFKELKESPFKYQNHVNKNVNSYFDEFIGYMYRNNEIYETEQLHFSKNFNKFYAQIKNLNEKYVVYGNGTVGKTINVLIPENIVAFVDKNQENIHPKNLLTLQYDKIIISVLGREQEIMQYLLQEFHIEQEKIILIDI